MSKFKKHVTREMKQWESNQAAELAKIRAAQRHLIYNVVAYCSISVIEYWLAAISRSQTLRADAFNNLSGIISTVLLMMGLHIAQDIHDDDIAGVKLPGPKYQQHLGGDQRIQFVRWRYETVFSLVTAVVMIAIALSVIISGIRALLNPASRVVPDPVALIGAGIASVIMLVVWYMNRQTGRKLQNAALLASAQDSLSDAFTSIGTMVAIGGALLFQLSWLDGVTSIIVGFFILYSGLKIFFETSLNLADYFDPAAEKQYAEAIGKVKHVRRVVELKAHYNGNVVSLDATLIVNGKMTVLESYQLSEEIERMMRKKFGIIDVDISFMPDPHSFSDKDVKGHF
ncbi:cation diffusion facilitator family transporter [Limosilactobacillus sp.]|uniref:cation diffusion facilitator family transporter n=1 Tax=Limosilactobacillus sp. TaxID=2773925 RepID=UPI0025BE8DD8|nr:cation diffusion facilitator family transporter [Limosilactobacillus sp.]MCH3921424.1 cation diffusion facilitator family transporter [Limosilactobacillus sp.]MCH3928195.1 cation diffusion facilitator family transporter [Limosilactobacillus sp.]